jgi:hypothetical protein
MIPRVFHIQQCQDYQQARIREVVMASAFVVAAMVRAAVALTALGRTSGCQTWCALARHR